ncbi:conjugative transfer system coupling protein TraD [uncultured Sutterella sp.]|uniref:conjugative transfer system coupling protein TraD n=1 Tax=uncultured Sutterella sp. TaxID=286133 RepID=UPI00259B3928|nr:conjugative transfer system coupling protein TraD [uncultured Sutterella sp.]
MNKNALRISGFRDRARDTSGVTGNALALYRPAWEVRPAIWNLGAAAFASAAALSGNLPASWGILWGTGALLLSAWRWKEALAVWKRRAPLSGFEPLFMTMEDLVLRLREMSGRRLPEAARTGARFPLLLQSGGTGRTRHGSAFGEARNPRVLFLSQAEPRVENVWFGMGFPWTPVEAQKLEELSRVPRDVMTVPPGIRPLVTQDRGLSEKEIGSPILHGVGPGEAPIERPIRSLGGGTLLVGTTQAGKGVMLTSLIAQAILRGDAVIVIDPKSSKRLRGAIHAACAAAGREPPHEFHPAFPARGVRLDPLGSWTRATEIASRVTAILPPESDGVFTSFAWEAVHVMSMGLLFAGEKPSLGKFRRILAEGIEPLFAKCLDISLEKHVPYWRDRVIAIMEVEAASLSAPPGSRASLSLLARIALWERSVSEDQKEPEVAGLLSVFRHSREHYAKITASLVPALSMLTSGPLGKSLSPDPDDIEDDRPIVTVDRVLDAGGVLYLGLDALPDPQVAGSLGALILSDMAASAGRRYNLDRSGDEAASISLFVDETANVINRPLIEILNKGMQAADMSRQDAT